MIVRFVSLVLLVAATVAVGSQAPGSQAGTAPPLDPAFEALVDKYLREVRGVGGSLPADMSAAAFARRLETQKALLAEVEAFNRGTLTVEQDVDHRFLRGILRANVAEESAVQRWRMDPRVYVETNPVTFKMVGDHRDPDERGEALVRDMEVLQARVTSAQVNLTRFMPRWLPYANARIDGTITHIDTSLKAFARRLSPPLRDRLVTSTDKAITALKGYKTFVNGEWTRKPLGEFAYGAPLFNTLQRERHQLDGTNYALRTITRAHMPDFTSVPGYYEWGWKQYRLVEEALERKARMIDPAKTWRQIIRETKQDHPAAEQLVYTGIRISRWTREWVVKNDLVSIPWKDDDQIMVNSDPSMSASQWWGFGPGFLPAGHQSTKMAWPIIPIQPEWTDAVAQENLTEKDYSFMYAIAPHEAYPGHHLMRLYQNRNPRKLRVYENSYSDQGWCYYVEWELTPDAEYGFFPKAKQQLYELEILRLKLWRMGRVIIDAGLHTGALAWDDAVNIESERTGFVRRGAEINVDGISAAATGTAAPTVGYFEWMLLREDYFNKMRELDQKGTLKDFHDRIYRIGFLPVSLVREELFHQLEREFRRPRSF